MAEGQARFHKCERTHTRQKRLPNNGKSDGLLDIRPHEPPSQPCPECGGFRVFKDGKRKLTDGSKAQRWLCRSCGYRFSSNRNIEVDVRSQVLKTFDSRNDSHENGVVPGSGPVQKSPDGLSLLLSKDVRSHGLSSVEKRLYALPFYNSNAECASKRAKNLSNATELKTVAGESPKQDDSKSPLFQYAWWMKKEGYAEDTITTRVKILRILCKRGAVLNDPETIKEAIARQSWSSKRKVNAADAYTAFLRMNGGSWQPPRYRVEQTLPFLPTEAEIDALIAGCGFKTSTFLLLLKETGMRCGEANKLQWTDLDIERGTVRVTPEKGSKPRMFKLSSNLLSRLLTLKARAESNRIFCKHVRTQRRLFQKQRKNLARKLHNPRLLQIHFHSFRHWKGTMEYHKTKDILHVMQVLGHRNINNTLIYTQLLESKDDDYVSKVAKTAEEARQLVEDGFDYVCTTPECLMLFKKRK
jgi:integrase